jgi:LysR family transcriptional regulator of gallate degradation
MTLNLRHLYAFCEAARLQSISGAARLVHLSQPAITQAIAGVEQYFGAKLLDRSSSGVALTQPGQLCLDRAQRALSEVQAGIAEADGGSAVRAATLVRQIRSAHLAALITVVQHRNFSAAARARGLSQPSIHRAARKLESVLRVPLFERTSFGVVPTREAERLARRSKLALAEIGQARAEIAALYGGDTGSTVIGAMPLARAHILPGVLTDFSAQFPQHRISIMDGTYDHLLAALQSGEADFLIGALRDPSKLAAVVQEHLFDDPLIIAVRADHPLVRKNRTSLPALLEYPWVAPRAGSPLRAHFTDLFASGGLETPSALIECNSIDAARALLLDSDRVMLLSPHQVYHELRTGLLVALPHPSGNVSRPIGLTLRRGWRPTSSQEHLLRLLRERSHHPSVERIGVRRATSRLPIRAVS